MRAEQNAVLPLGGLWSRQCRHLDSHPYEHGDPPAHGAVGLPAGSAAVLPGRPGRVAAVLCGPGAGIGADRMNVCRHNSKLGPVYRVASRRHLRVNAMANKTSTKSTKVAKEA